MSALLDAQSQSATGSATTASKSRSAALKDLFGQIDGDGDGKISKSEFEEALGAGGTNLKQADSVFGKLDKDGDGSVSLKDWHRRCGPRDIITIAIRKAMAINPVPIHSRRP